MSKQLNSSSINLSTREKIAEQLNIDITTIDNISMEEAFNAYLRYEGIIGYTSQIISVLDDLRNAEAEAEWSIGDLSTSETHPSCPKPPVYGLPKTP